MKKIVLFSFIILSIAIGCRSKKKTSSSTADNSEAAQLAAAKVKFPDATEGDMKKGHELYFGTCTKCHSAKTITSISEEEWPSIIDRMAKKAKITPEEKDAVLKYVTGVKVAGK